MLKVIITDTFLKDYKKVLKNIDIENFANKIKTISKIDEIYLKKPIIKLKIKISNIHIRLVGKYVESKLIFIPIFIFKKADKKKGINLIWETIEDEIDLKFSKIDLDLQNGNYNIY